MIAPALGEVADALTAAGIPAAVDPRDVNLPGAWVQHVSHDADLLSPGCVTALFRVLLIAPDVGTLRALEMLDDLESDARLVLVLNAGSVTDRTVQLPDSATYYPTRVLETLVQNHTLRRPGMTVKAYKLNNGKLTLGTTPLDVSCQLTTFTLNPTEDVETEEAVHVLCGDVLDASDTVSYSFTMSGTGFQDLEEGGFVEFTWTNAGQEVPFVFTPDLDQEATFSGTVRPYYLPVGGEAPTRATSDFEWVIVGDPDPGLGRPCPVSVGVEGVDTLAATMGEAATELATLTDGHHAAARILLQRGSALAPRRSGKLAGSGRAVVDGTGLHVTWGSASVPYAGVINFGWPARGIRAQPFATDPLERNRTDLETAYRDAAQAAIDTIHA